MFADWKAAQSTAGALWISEFPGGTFFVEAQMIRCPGLQASRILAKLGAFQCEPSAASISGSALLIAKFSKVRTPIFFLC